MVYVCYIANHASHITLTNPSLQKILKTSTTFNVLNIYFFINIIVNNITPTIIKFKCILRYWFHRFVVVSFYCVRYLKTSFKFLSSGIRRYCWKIFVNNKQWYVRTVKMYKITGIWLKIACLTNIFALIISFQALVPDV